MDIKDHIELLSIDEIHPYGNNPKTHPSEQVEKIASSIRQFGWDQPIVVDGEGEIIKGHGRYKAAKKLALARVPVITQSDLTEAQARAARIADNKSSESSWDEDLLSAEMALLNESADTLESTGFDDDELDDLLDEPPMPEEFGEVEEVVTEHECPECGYEW